MPNPENTGAAPAVSGERMLSPLDNANSYGLISRLNHWLGAALVIALLGIGLYFADMPRGPDKLFWMKLHFSIGTLAFLPLAFRIAWRLKSAGPAAFAQPLLLQRLTSLVHGVLLLGIGILIVSGPFTVWTAGRAIEVFGWFSLPSPTGEMKTAHEVLENIHVITANVLLWTVVLHVLGAAKHLLFERERLTGRMFGR